MRLPALVALSFSLASVAALTGCPNNNTPVQGDIGGTTGGAGTGGSSSKKGTSGGSTTGGSSGAASSGSTGSTSAGSTGSTSSGSGSTGGSSSSASTSGGSTGAASTGSSTSGGGSTGGVDAGPDAGEDAGLDAGPDAGVDAGPDAGPDAGFDAGPPCDAGIPEFESCSTNADCSCPYQCLSDQLLGGTVCEEPCTQSSDCTNIATTCRGGACNLNFCGEYHTLPDGGQNGNFSGTCDSSDAGDGTCYPLYTPANDAGPASASWYCFQGGTATGNCNAVADRTDPAGLCTAGSLCFSNDGGSAGTCQGVCDPTGPAATCGTGFGCSPADLVDQVAPSWGICFAEDASGTCIETGLSSEFEPCGPNAQCGCVAGVSFSCVEDDNLAAVLYGGANQLGSYQFCERPCATSNDCAVPTSACSNTPPSLTSTWCSYDFCGDPATTDGLSTICDAAGTGDGTCVPVSLDGVTVAYGLCTQGGSVLAGAACDPNATRAVDAAGLCVAGDLCFDTGTVGAPTYGCEPICNPDAGEGACTSPAVCNTNVLSSPPPDLGVCQ